MWVTSHHPVLVGNEWVYPADLGPATPFSSVADQAGRVCVCVCDDIASCFHADIFANIDLGILWHTNTHTHIYICLHPFRQIYM